MQFKGKYVNIIGTSTYKLERLSLQKMNEQTENHLLLKKKPLNFIPWVLQKKFYYLHIRINIVTFLSCQRKSIVPHCFSKNKKIGCFKPQKLKITNIAKSNILVGVRLSRLTHNFEKISDYGKSFLSSGLKTFKMSNTFYFHPFCIRVHVHLSLKTTLRL